MQSPRAFRTVGISASKQESFFQALGRDPTQSTFPPELCLNVIIREILSLHKTFFQSKNTDVKSYRKAWQKKVCQDQKFLRSSPPFLAQVPMFRTSFGKLRHVLISQVSPVMSKMSKIVGCWKMFQDLFINAPMHVSKTLSWTLRMESCLKTSPWGTGISTQKLCARPKSYMSLPGFNLKSNRLQVSQFSKQKSYISCIQFHPCPSAHVTNQWISWAGDLGLGIRHEPGWEMVSWCIKVMIKW